jgi:hypothetical protein
MRKLYADRRTAGAAGVCAQRPYTSLWRILVWRALQGDRAHGIQSVMLHLRVQGCGLHPQQSRRLRLIATAVIEGSLDQLDFIALDLVVKVDAVVIDSNPIAVAVGGKLGLQTLYLAGQRFRQQR